MRLIINFINGDKQIMDNITHWNFLPETMTYTFFNKDGSQLRYVDFEKKILKLLNIMEIKMQPIKIYSRIISKRVPINRFGKLGFKSFKQIVKTDNINAFNFRKRIKFEIDENYVSNFDKLEKDVIIEFEI